MDRTACSPGLLQRALRLVADVQVVEVENGFVEVTWFRYHGKLRSLWKVREVNATLGLRELIELESERVRKSAHGEDCPCEDCLIARVDRARQLARKRKP